MLNPHAGRDIRRLVAPASSLSNHERTNVARRILAGLRAAGVRQVLFMPERYGLVARSAAELPEMRITAIFEACTDTPEDTRRATRALVAAGVQVLVTHGGDGTNRWVALEAGQVPILPIAAGTNNVFPAQVEPTAAGLAAGVLATHCAAGGSPPDGCVQRAKRIRVVAGAVEEMALIDAAVTRDTAIGGRAVWDPARIVAFMVTQAAAGCVGLAGIAGALRTIAPTDPRGAFVEMGPGTRVLALMAPGLVVPAEVAAVRDVVPGQALAVGPLSGVITLDGERALQVRHERVQFYLADDGPWVVDVPATLAWAQARGAFRLDST